MSSLASRIEVRDSQWVHGRVGGTGGVKKGMPRKKRMRRSRRKRGGREERACKMSRLYSEEALGEGQPCPGRFKVGGGGGRAEYAR